MATRLGDVLPELTNALAAAFESDGMMQLAQSFPTLVVWDRCRCDDDGCATVYTEDKDLWLGQTLDRVIPSVSIPGLLCIQVLGTRVVCIELLNRPDLKRKLVEALLY